MVTEEKDDNWKFPRLGLLREFQANRGLTMDLLETCQVWEIVLGSTSTEEVLEIHEWAKVQHGRDQVSLPCSAISLDVEDQQTFLYDVYRMCGKIILPEQKKILSTWLEDDMRHGLPKDKWRQIPAKIMYGNGTSWKVVITVDLGSSSSPWLSRQTVQEELIDLIEDLPVCIGLGIKADVSKIEEFYSFIAGRSVKMHGFVDLSVRAVIAGWRMNSRGMTCVGVQICGTILNKCVSTGDGMWGRKWRHIPASLQVYGIGDIKFGYIAMVY